jgi:hypothetical protein
MELQPTYVRVTSQQGTGEHTQQYPALVFILCMGVVLSHARFYRAGLRPFQVPFHVLLERPKFIPARATS